MCVKSVDHSPQQQSFNNIMIKKKKKKRSGNILQKFNTIKSLTTQLSLNHFHYLEGKKKLQIFMLLWASKPPLPTQAHHAS